MSGHVLEQLSAYLDGELGREEQAAVYEHLGVCAECAQRLDELSALDAVARSLPASAPAGYFEDLPARVRARLEAPRHVARWPVWSWAAAAAVLLAALTPAVLHRATAPAARPALEQERPAAAPAEPGADAFELEDEASQGRVTRPKAEAPSAPMPAAPPATRIESRPRAAARAPSARQPEQVAPGFAPAPQPASPPPITPAPEIPASGALESATVRDLQAARKQAVAEGEARSTAAGTAAAGPTANQSLADARYAWLLAAAAPDDADAARGLRDAWRAFARDQAAHAGADEARVRAIEAGAEAYRLGRDPRDLDGVRADAQAYLARPDAAQSERVRALLRRLEQ